MAAPVTTREATSPISAVREGPRRRRWNPGVVTAVLIVAALTLMLLDVRGGPTDLLRAVGAAIGGPLQSAASGLLGAIPEQVQRPDADALRQRVARLEAENDHLSVANELLAEQFSALAGERALNHFAETVEGATVTARVVGAVSPPAQAAVTIDAGADAGIVPDSAVLVPDGVVGRIVQVGPTTSTVQLITSPDSGIAVRLERSRQTGLVQGTADPHRLALRHVDPLAPLQAGEAVLTMGSADGRPFPAGLPVGTLHDVGTVGDVNRRLAVVPAVELGRLDGVVVVNSAESTGSRGDTGSGDGTGADEGGETG